MSVCGQLDIGPLRFTLRHGSGAAYDADCPYPGFVPASTPARPQVPLAELPVTVCAGARPAPAGAPAFCAGRNWAVWAEAETLTFCAGFHDRGLARRTCRVSRQLDRAELFFDEKDHEAPLAYPIDQALAWGMLARCGGVLLHAALVVKDGRGCLLAGRSGVGKSTLSGLCAAAGWTVYSDDRAIVFQRGGQWRAAGTPWHGSSRFSRDGEVGLGGLYFLQQDRVDRCEAMEKHAARLALLDVASVPWFDDDWSQGALQALDRLACQAPCGRLHFTRSSSAVAALEEAEHVSSSGAGVQETEISGLRR